jgi:hypothetical protein
MQKHFLWTVSHTVLSWFQRSPSYWKIFTGNRAAEIQSLTSVSYWRYAPGRDNPADHVSCGIDPKCLASLYQWWFVPYWLRSECSSYNSDVVLEAVELREVKIFPIAALIFKSANDEWLLKF